jgi:hypothetical protein
MRKVIAVSRAHNEIYVILILFCFLAGVMVALFSNINENVFVKQITSVFLETYNDYWSAFFALFLLKAKFILLSALLSLTIFGAIAIPVLTAAYGILITASLNSALQTSQRILAVSISNLLDAVLFIPIFLIFAIYLIQLSLSYAGLLRQNKSGPVQSKQLIPLQMLKLMLLLFITAAVVSLAQAPVLIF